MGSVPVNLVTALRDELGLQRAVETGTYRCQGTRRLARVFAEVATIELSDELFVEAQAKLGRFGNVHVIHGDSGAELPGLAELGVPTLYFLDSHWSGGVTAGEGYECPLLSELAAIAPGHPDDCILVDDARCFQFAPPPPHDPHQWPTLLEVMDGLRSAHPEHHVTVVNDMVVAAPERARPLIDQFGRDGAEAPLGSGFLRFTFGAGRALGRASTALIAASQRASRV